MRLRFRRRLEPNTHVNLVPMIDVVFQLVVFLMVTTTFKITPAVVLSLPDSTSAQPVTVSDLVVSVVSRQEVYVNNGDPGSLDELEAQLSRIGRPRPEEIRSIIIEAGRGVPYEVIVEVLDAVRQSGFTSVALRTKAVPRP